MSRPRLAAAAAVAAVLAIQARLIARDPWLARDDRSLLEPLRRMTSPVEYAAAVRAGRILDLQPLRDLSLWLELQFDGWSGVGTFHATNVLLWLLACALAYRLLREWGCPGADLAAFALAVHPVAMTTVAWLSARKHLLAAALLLLASLALERGRTDARRRWSAAAVVAYGCSLLAQPIGLFWPAFALVRGAFREPAGRRRAQVVAALCLPLLVAAAVLNLRHYAAAGSTKFAGGPPEAAFAVLAWGRSFWNLVAPLGLATIYAPENPRGFVGLALLAAALLASLRFGVEVWSGSWALFVLPLAVVAVRPTNIFVSDTYLLLPLVAVVALAAHGLARAQGTARRALACAALVLLPLAAAREVRAWESDFALWQAACEREGTPLACARWADQLLRAGRPREAMAAADAAARTGGASPVVDQAWSRAVAAQVELPAEARLRRLDGRPALGAWHHYFRGSLLGQLGRLGEAEIELRQAVALGAELGPELSLVAAETTRVCERASRRTCDAIAAEARKLPRWDEAAFRERLQPGP